MWYGPRDNSFRIIKSLLVFFFHLTNLLYVILVWCMTFNRSKQYQPRCVSIVQVFFLLSFFYVSTKLFRQLSNIIGVWLHPWTSLVSDQISDINIHHTFFGWIILTVLYPNFVFANEISFFFFLSFFEINTKISIKMAFKAKMDIKYLK